MNRRRGRLLIIRGCYISLYEYRLVVTGSVLALDLELYPFDISFYKRTQIVSELHASKRNDPQQSILILRYKVTRFETEHKASALQASSSQQRKRQSYKHTGCSRPAKYSKTAYFKLLPFFLN